MIKKIKDFLQIKFSKYDNSLINDLQAEHKQLLNDFLEIEKLLKEGYLNKSLFLLRIFRENFLNHIKKEETKLYPYLKKVSKNKDWIIQKEEEMRHILEILEKKLFIYQISEINKNLNEIKNYLVKRISEEERILFKEYLANKH